MLNFSMHPLHTSEFNLHFSVSLLKFSPLFKANTCCSNSQVRYHHLQYNKHHIYFFYARNRKRKSLILQDIDDRRNQKCYNVFTVKKVYLNYRLDVSMGGHDNTEAVCLEDCGFKQERQT